MNSPTPIPRISGLSGHFGLAACHMAAIIPLPSLPAFFIIATAGSASSPSSPNRTNTKHLEGKITFLHGDLTDQNSLLRCLKESQPDEVYNLGSQSFVGESWNTPEQTSDVTGLGVVRM